MKRTKTLALFGVAACLFQASLAQETKPIVPQTQDIKVPPAVTLPLPPGISQSQPLTADEAARVALANQPLIAIARAAILAAHGRVLETRSALLPQVGVTGSYNATDTFRNGTSTGVQTSGGSQTGNNPSTSTSSGKSPGFSSTLQVNQLIFDFNHTRDLVRQAAAAERAANHGLTAAQADLIYQVKLAFYTYVQNTKLVDVNEANVANQQGQVDLAQARLTTGLGQPIDLVTAKTNLGNAVTQLAQARANALNSRIALALQMGIDPRTPIVASESSESEIDASDLNQLVTSALQHRPDVLQAIETVQAALHGSSAAKTYNAPSLGVNFGLGSKGPTDPVNSQNAFVGVTLTWNFGDEGLTSGLVKQAEAAVQTAKAQLTQVTQTAVSDVSQAYVNLVTAKQKVTIAQAEVANAQEALRIAEGRYRAGLGIFLDVTTAQTGLVTAQSNLVNAQTSVDQAAAALARAAGANLPAALK